MKMISPIRSLAIVSGCAALVVYLASEPVAAFTNDDVAAHSNEKISDSVRRALPFIAEEGRAWMDGQVPIQDGQNCVSCHQVPSGIWALALAYDALEQDRSDDLEQLIEDAVEHTSDPTIGRPAMWAQILIVLNFDQSSKAQDESSQLLLNASQEWRDQILDSQQSDGRWLAKGQFPAQKRPEIESDAVVTMWMLTGLETYSADDEKVAQAKKRAVDFLDGQSGKSTEWLAWRVLSPSADSGNQRRQFTERLLTSQNDDGGWGWQADAPSDPYSTGVALFAMSIRQSEQFPFTIARTNAIDYLLSNQLEDGTWKAPSRLFTKSESDSRDYVYHYWGTAWATLGLAAELSSRRDAYASESSN